jgi:biopolymer transport protein ExbB
VENQSIYEFLVEGIIDFIQMGGYVMPPLFIMTLTLWYMLGYRYYSINRGRKAYLRPLIKKYLKNPDKKVKGIIDGAILKAIEISHDERILNKRAYLDEAFYPYQKDLTRYKKVIFTLVAAAPLAGLLGTVTGMIETFDSLASSSLFSASGGGIAGGISQALFTTQMGLVISVPGLIVSKILDREEEVIQKELDQIKDIFCCDEIYLEDL